MELIEGVVRHYDWGDDTFIPKMLGKTPDGTPYAELWFGAHPSAPSQLVDSGVSLQQAVQADPTGVLGAAGGEQTGFPFLAKVLAATQNLSIQVHPDPDQARKGFAAENDAGVPLDAPDRTYRDPFDKPELICAVTPFSAKCGLRPVERTLALLDQLSVPSLDPITRRLSAGSPPADRLRSVIKHLFEMEPDQVADMVEATVTAAATADPDGPFARELAWTERLATAHPGDVGNIVALLLNHVELQPGQALFLGAGNMHSYLEGVAIEVMAPSDNVVRGGLTSKHIDTSELLALLDTTPIAPAVQTPAGPIHAYDVKGDVFGLTRLDLDQADPGLLAESTLRGPGVLICTHGTAMIAGADQTLQVDHGQTAFVRASDGGVSVTGTGTVHWANSGG